MVAIERADGRTVATQLAVGVADGEAAGLAGGEVGDGDTEIVCEGLAEGEVADCPSAGTRPHAPAGRLSKSASTPAVHA